MLRLTLTVRKEAHRPKALADPITPTLQPTAAERVMRALKAAAAQEAQAAVLHVTLRQSVLRLFRQALSKKA
jgi:hypothetical protein